MGAFFGTDGIRGEYGKNLNCDFAFKVGNAISQIKQFPQVVVGRDTRLSGDALLLALSAGLVQGGAKVVSVGVLPTAGVSFLTQTQNFDFGVMITASHNPAIFNGIKVFDRSGRKLSDGEEDFLEEFFKTNHISFPAGSIFENFTLSKSYQKHLKSSVDLDLQKFSVVLDAGNGAASKIAPKVFKSLGARVYTISCGGDGEKINDGCGCLHPENLSKKVKKLGADVGFAFDGDADRVVAVSGSGEIYDGDKLLYILAKDMKERGLLYGSCVVGTSHTNSGIMAALNRNKINLIRTDIGDKYVIEAMEKMNLTLGGEQSGHIIIKTDAQTGDGILTALKICEIIKRKKVKLDQLFDAKLTPQCNINVQVKDKIKVINNENLKNLSLEIANEIAPFGRILIRASGTEEKVRIMVEHPSQAEKFARMIERLIESI